MASIRDNVKQLIGRSLDAYNKKQMKATNDRIDNIVAQSGTDNTEIVDARIDTIGNKHETLNNRIKSETKIMGERLLDVTGEYISVEGTVPGPIGNIEIFGNTVQNPDNLADIKSVCDLQEDGMYEMSILSCNKNLFDKNDLEMGRITSQGTLVDDSTKVRTKGFISVLPSTQYSVSKNASGYITVISYDKDCKFDSYIIDSNTSKAAFTTKSSTKYVKIVNSQTSLSLDMNIQLEEGTQTPYVSHKSNKSSILLPCQLEKVGDVADRLYFDKGEGAWCIDKNVKNSIFKKEDLINNNGHSYQIRNFDMLPKKSWNSVVGTFATVGSGYIQEVGTFDEIKNMQSLVYHLDTNGLMINASIGLYNEMTSNKYLSIKYPTTTQQKIVLPKSVQIALNSHLDTTYIYFADTEVEPTIKCKVSKSLGASVESLHNKTDILEGRVSDIEGLKSSQDMKYSTDKGYLVCKETMDGVVKDMIIKGKTLVNLCTIVNRRSGAWGYLDIDSSRFVIDKEYTAVLYGLPKGFRWFVGEGNTSFAPYHEGVTNTFIVKTKDTSRYVIHVNDGGKTEVTMDMLNNISVVILEGDHTQNPPGYFEGMKSVGEDVDNIEVLSRKEDGNLFDGNARNGYYANGIFYAKDTDLANCNPISIEPNTNYATFSDIGDDVRKTFYDETMKYISISSSVVALSPANSKYINIHRAGAKTMCIYKDVESNGYRPHKSDKKPILYQDKITQEWKPVGKDLPLHEWDEVDGVESKLYKRSGKVVLNGSESWTRPTNVDQSNTIAFVVTIEGRELALLNLISDKFHTEDIYNIDKEGIRGYTSSNGVMIRISKSKLKTQDVAGFKEWLQSNNVTVVYQLAQEEVYDIAPITVDAYSNETMISLECGAINPTMDFSITSYITNLVKNNRSDIKRLQNDFYTYTVAQNRMLLDSKYTADHVTFRTDIASEQVYVNSAPSDVYDLLYDNIIIGKDNYNRERMEMIINDYFMWFVIDFDAYIELLDMIELQHNPPIIESPEEI